MWSGVWQCLWKDTESYPPALPLLSPAPSPPRPRWLPLGFPDMGSQAAPPVPTVLPGLGSPQAQQQLLCQAQKAAGFGGLGQASAWEPLAGWLGSSLQPPWCLGEGLLLTTGSGRPQPGRRRRHPLPHRKAGSRRRRRGSSPPRHTVRKEI